ncbi:hypothetical protein SNE40_007396 [Patella caerulea]|uniref:Peptidoglycan recognition protein n=1 Tax=Patella caerulea TaxID=87958 RepID=A0AAN8K4I1_PATCE
MSFSSLGAGDSKCRSSRGKCQYTYIACSGGNFRRYLCSGPNNRQCCIKPISAGDSKCTSKGGNCQLTSLPCFEGNYRRDLCAGSYNRQCCLVTSTITSSGNNPTIVSRASWGARSTRLRNIRLPVRRVFIHHTVGSTCTSRESCSRVVRNTQNYHMNTRKYSDIGYSFLVGEDGRVYEGRGWNKQGAHTRGYNTRSIAIAFLGNFSNRQPNGAALTAAQDLIAYGVNNNKISPSYSLSGHRDANGANTACPGQALYNVIKTWPRYTSST